jgi:hypothetical protein
VAGAGCAEFSKSAIGASFLIAVAGDTAFGIEK